MGSILDIVLSLVEAGVEVAPFLKKLYETFENSDEPTPSELDDLRAMEAKLDQRINEPLPPDDGTYE